MPGPPPNPTRGVRRIELTTPEPEPAADFLAGLLGWAVIAEADGSFTGWVGDRLATHVRTGTPGWRVVFAATDTTDPEELRCGAWTDRGRVLHGPWAPPPRPGEPCWTELMGTTAADDHYWTDRLGWHTRDPDADFTLYDAQTPGERRAVAGRLTTPGQAGWMCYFAVPDTALAAEAAVRLGGRVVVEPREVPTGLVAAVTEPTGAVFALLQDPPGWGGTWSQA